MLTNLRVRVYEPEIFWNYFEIMVEPAALNCTLGEHSYKNDNPNDVKLSKLIQLGLKIILDGKFWYFMKLQYS